MIKDSKCPICQPNIISENIRICISCRIKLTCNGGCKNIHNPDICNDFVCFIRKGIQSRWIGYNKPSFMEAHSHIIENRDLEFK
jgi:hypothetical protein